VENKKKDIKMKRLGALIGTLLLTGFAGGLFAGSYGGGSGMEADPYQIGSVANWQELIATPGDWDKHFIIMADLNFSGVSGWQ